MNFFPDYQGFRVLGMGLNHFAKIPMKLLQPLFLGSLLFGSFFAQAQTQTSPLPSRELQRLIRSEQKKCPNLNCPDRRIVVEKLSPTEVKALDQDQRSELRQRAREQALNLWPDTILEGPFESQFRIRVDLHQRVKLDGQMIGYRLLFSDKAWNTDHCHQGGEDRLTPAYKNCQTGRIFDSIYILNDLKTHFRDSSQTARFYVDGSSQMPLSVPAQTDLSLNSRFRKTLHGFSRLNLPMEDRTCSVDAIQTALAQNIQQIEDLIYDERGLQVCDEHQRSNSCFEPSALSTLLARVYPVEGSSDYETDSGYALCDHSPECFVQARMRCLNNSLAFELK